MRNIAQELNAGQLAISDSLSDLEIQSLVAEFGYPADQLNEGKTEWDFHNAMLGVKVQVIA